MIAGTWRDEYSVNIEAIDEQHKRLLSLLNAVNEGARRGRGGESLEETVRRLLIYARTHFAHEERLMSVHGYPGYEPHKREHDELVRLAAELQESVKEGDGDEAADLIMAIRELLMKHIIDNDKRYGSFFNCRGVV
jgi:hemerythrin